MIREEPELLTDIRDFTTRFYVTFRRSPPNGESRRSESDDLQYIWSVDLAIRDFNFLKYC